MDSPPGPLAPFLVQGSGTEIVLLGLDKATLAFQEELPPYPIKFILPLPNLVGFWSILDLRMIFSSRVRTGRRITPFLDQNFQILRLVLSFWRFFADGCRRQWPPFVF